MIAAIVVAAGQGRRFGGEIPKQFLQLRDRPILAYSLLTFDHHPAVDNVVLVTSPSWKSYIEQEIVARFKIRKVAAIVDGAQERQDSVAAGLEAVNEALEFVVVHDAVRPFFSPQLLERVIAACRHADAGIPAILPRDTVKQVNDDTVVRTLPRQELRLAQTPQVFRREALIRAFDHAKTRGLLGTDEAALVEAAGGRVRWVEGEERNLKITTPLDLKIAEIFMEGST